MNKELLNEILHDIQYENCNGSFDGMQVYIKTVKRFIYLLSYNDIITKSDRETIFEALEQKAHKIVEGIKPYDFW